MKIENGNAKPCGGLGGARHGVGNVVVFQVQEDRHAHLDKGRYTGRSMGIEEFQAKLQPAHARGEISRQPAGVIEIGGVERDKDRIGRRRRLHASGVPPFNLSRNSFPVRKKGARFWPTETGSPVRGFRPMREGRTLTLKAPKPRSATRW